MTRRVKFHVAHLAVFCFVALGAMCQENPKPAPTVAAFAKPTAEQKLAIREAQVQVRDIQSQMTQVADFFNGLKKALEAAQTAEKTAREKAKQANGCPECELSETLDLIKPVPPPAANAPNPPTPAAEPEKKP